MLSRNARPTCKLGIALTASYVPPADLWEVNRALQLDEPLEGPTDARWVDTEAARGEYSLRSLYRALGVEGADPDSPRSLRQAPTRGYYLFCGHRGCGKSTELRRIRNDLHAPDIYYVVFADAARDLDPNNLRYQDALLHLAATLTRQIQEDGVFVPSVHFERLESWFDQRVREQSEIAELTSQVKVGAELGAGLPYLGKLLAAFSTAFKTNATYKETLRRALKNYFSGFADAFNHLIEAVEDALLDTGKGSRILFMVDGTDRLSEEDAHSFFITDVRQLQQVKGLFVYCAPIHLIYEAAIVRQSFHVFRLPMIRIRDAHESVNETGRLAMRRLLHLRAARDLFDDGVADYLIDHSGGHPRDLLRLLQLAFQYAEHDRFDPDAARRAVRETATAFRRILEPDDYRLMAAIDSGMGQPSSSERTRHLLYNLALLEYNDYFWRSHPAVRLNDAYRDAMRAIKEARNG